MEILYIHIKNKNKIQNQDLNFGSEYIFKYSVKLKELNISKNELFIDNFFSNENNDNIDRGEILNVTSIIGQNGTGKTSILNLIRENFPKGYNSITSEMIFALKEDEKIKIYYDETIIIEKTNAHELNISLIKLTQINKVINSKKKGEYKYKVPYSIKDFNNTDFVFFSNVFDGTGGNNINGYRDISTNHLVFNDYRRNIEFKTINSEDKRSELETYIFDDIERQLLFINGFKENNIIPFDLPEKIFILLKNDYSNKNFKNYNLNSNTQKKLIEIVDKVNISLMMTKDDFEKVKLKIVFNLFISFYIEINLSNSNILQTIESGNDIINLKNETINFNTIISIIGQFELLIKLGTNLKSLINTFKNFSNLLNYVNDLDLNNEVVTINENYISFNIKNKNIKEFHYFLDIYKNSYLFRPYFNLTWAGISSGEKALLNIYSRLYSLTPKIQRTDGLEKNIIILIDEGDVYLLSLIHI
jgi:ABC-type dipeptide/oligopeptide/nickel transport system ATPase component